MICRLCLKDSSEFTQIFSDLGIETNMSKIIAKHFWFQPEADDPISTSICNICWTKTSEFNDFYDAVEKSHRLLNERFSLSFDKRPTFGQTSIVKQQRSQKRQVIGTVKNKTQIFDEEDNLQIKDEPQKSIYSKATGGSNDGECDERETKEAIFSDEQEELIAINNADLCKETSENEHYDDNNNDEEDDDNIFEHNVKKVEEAEQQQHYVSDSKQFLTNKQKTNKPQQFTRLTRSRLNNKSSVEEVRITFSSRPSILKRNNTSKKKTKSNSTTLTPSLSSMSSLLTPTPSKRKRRNCTEINGSKEVNNDTDQPPAEKSRRNVEKISKINERIAEYMQLRCEICNAEHKVFPDLRKHMETLHSAGKGYAVCCGKKFYKRALLAAHVERHLNPESYKCEECDKVFADKHTIRNHMLLKHQPEEQKIFQCEHCAKKFAKLYILEQHRQRHDKPTHMCNICEKGFATLNFLANHNKIVHEKYGTMCDICAKVIRGRAAFERHQLEHQGIEPPKVQCNICGSWHKDKYSLQKHKRRHNESGEEHVCNICGKSSPNRSAMLSHQRFVHKSQRVFECGVCKKSFKTAVSLKEHMATHTGEVLYRCPHCSRTFNSNANMHAHRKKSHPKEFEEARRSRNERRKQPPTLGIPTANHPTTPPEHSEVISPIQNSKITKITIVNDDLSDGDMKTETHNVLVITDNSLDDEDQEGANIIFTVE